MSVVKLRNPLVALGLGLAPLAVSATIALASLAAPTEAVQAQDAAGFQQYLAELRAQSLAAGVRAQTVDAVMPTLQFLPSVIKLDRAQPGGGPSSGISPYAPYRKKHVTADRIQLGRKKLAALRPLLQRIERDTGVPGRFIIAIYGKESGYGSFAGATDVPSALATLAYEGRRRTMFAGEFVAAMQMIDGGVPRWKMKGSWAGAMGYPQFMPSVYQRLAVDGDHDGLADIWSNEDDALSSIAHYFQESGWRRGEPWGFAVSLPAGLNRAAIQSPLAPPRCARVFERHSRWQRISEWRAMGIVPKSGYWAADDTTMATLLEPDGAGNTAYLLTSNYRVILDYNCSNFYALTVGILADEIGS